MPRPFKKRCIGVCPQALFFKPRGIPMHRLEEVLLTLDEVEALRLADKEGLYQEDAARQMDVSRQTFGNIIASARHKVARALVDGQALKIEGSRWPQETKETISKGEE